MWSSAGRWKSGALSATLWLTGLSFAFHGSFLDGRSLVRLIEGHDEDWPNTVYSELWKAENGPSVMVREGDLKYFRVDSGAGWPEQLFDLSRDPEERHNLIDDPVYAEALGKLRSKVAALPPPRRKDEDNRFIDPYRPMVQE